MCHQTSLRAHPLPQGNPASPYLWRTQLPNRAAFSVGGVYLEPSTNNGCVAIIPGAISTQYHSSVTHLMALEGLKEKCTNSLAGQRRFFKLSLHHPVCSPLSTPGQTQLAAVLALLLEVSAFPIHKRDADFRPDATSVLPQVSPTEPALKCVCTSQSTPKPSQTRRSNLSECFKV